MMTPVPRKPRTRVLHLPEKTPRFCRDSMARTTLVVLRAASSVSRLCSVTVPTFTPSRIHTCSELNAAVKSYLSTNLGSSEETQMAFQSIKKLLPDSCRCLKSGLLSDLRTRLCRPPPTLPSDYLPFARKIAKDIFKNGWDSNWEHAVNSFSPSLHSCTGFGRKAGGQLGALAVSGQSAFKDEIAAPKGALKGELLLVDSSGKPRPLTRFGPEAVSLRPLHGLIYDLLSKQPWLLRGDVSAEALQGAGFDPSRRYEEPLTSGDYKSASDNLSIEVAEALLDVAWSSARHVPANVFRYALAAQRPELEYEGEDHLRESFTPTRGQMMGSYLCFPLLCLQNYVAFCYAESKYSPTSQIGEHPVLINGDDILFQGTKGFSDFWMEVVGGLSLEVEKTKTSVSCEFGTLNSTLVRWRPEGLFVVKTLRFGMLRECGHPQNLGACAALFSRVGDRAVDWLRNFCEFLSWHAATIIKWRACLSDMGFCGRLARRAFSKFRGGRLLWRDVVLHQRDLPRLDGPDCPHNIVMRGDEFIEVPERLVTKAVQRATSEWMAARKWELGRDYKSVKNTVLVSARANATRIENELNSWRTSLAEIKARVRNSTRTEHFVLDYLPWLTYFPGHDDGESGWSEVFHMGQREVVRETKWWRVREKRKNGVRIPKPVWREYHPDWFSIEGMCAFRNPSPPVPNLIPEMKEKGLFLVGSSIAKRMLIAGFSACWRPGSRWTKEMLAVDWKQVFSHG